jgi:hypothetical protein
MILVMRNESTSKIMLEEEGWICTGTARLHQLNIPSTQCVVGVYYILGGGFVL